MAEGDQLTAIQAEGLDPISLYITTPEPQGELCSLLGKLRPVTQGKPAEVTIEAAGPTAIAEGPQ